MNAERALTESYQEWRRLAEVAGQGIAAGDWSRVSECHRAVLQLQLRISRLTPVVRRSWASPGGEPSSRAASLNDKIRDLLELVRRNRDLLTARKQAVRLHLNQVGVSARNLGQIRRSYGCRLATMRTAFA